MHPILKHIKDKAQPKPNQEWTYTDGHIKEVISLFQDCVGYEGRLSDELLNIEIFSVNKEEVVVYDCRTHDRNKFHMASPETIDKIMKLAQLAIRT